MVRTTRKRLDLLSVKSGSNKKWNKIQVTILEGESAASPVDYFVKYNNLLEVFTKNEFKQMYRN